MSKNVEKVFQKMVLYNKWIEEWIELQLYSEIVFKSFVCEEFNKQIDWTYIREGIGEGVWLFPNINGHSIWKIQFPDQTIAIILTSVLTSA